MQHYMQQLFSRDHHDDPKAEELRQILKHSIRDIVHQAMRRSPPFSRLDKCVREMADKISMKFPEGTNADETCVIKNTCQLLLEYVVSEITTTTPAEFRAAETVKCQWRLTEWEREIFTIMASD